MKEVTIKSKVVSRDGTGKPATGGGSQGAVDLSAYLLKQIWDSAFELKEKDGVQYLFGKIPLVLQYGLTSFADEGLVDLPSLYDGLPIDNQTLYWEKTTDANGEVIRLLKSKGGSGEGGGTISDIDMSGDGNAVTEVSLNAEKTGLVFTKGLTFAEKTYLDENFFAKEYVNEHFVTVDTSQTITGEKNFTGGLKVNGCELKYNSYYGYWELDGDLFVTGGISSFSSSTTFKPSTIMDGIVCDETTIHVNSYGQLEVIGGTGGGDIDEDAVKELIESYDYLTEDKLPIATTSVKGIASFDSSFFSVSGGHVSFSGGKVKVVESEPSSYESNTLYVIVG